MKTFISVMLVLVATQAFAADKWWVGNEPINDFGLELIIATGANKVGRDLGSYVGIKDPLKQDVIAFVVPMGLMIWANQFPDDGKHTSYSFDYRGRKDSGFLAAAQNAVIIGEHVAVRFTSKPHKNRTRWIYRASVTALSVGAFFIALNKNNERQ